MCCEIFIKHKYFEWPEKVAVFFKPWTNYRQCYKLLVFSQFPFLLFRRAHKEWDWIIEKRWMNDMEFSQHNKDSNVMMQVRWIRGTSLAISIQQSENLSCKSLDHHSIFFDKSCKDQSIKRSQMWLYFATSGH